MFNQTVVPNVRWSLAVAAATVGFVVLPFGVASGGMLEGVESLTSEQGRVLAQADLTKVGEDNRGSRGLLLGTAALATAGGAGAVIVLRRRRDLTVKRTALAANISGPETGARVVEQRYAQLTNQVDAWKQFSTGTTAQELDSHQRRADELSQRIRENLTSLAGATPNGVDNASDDELDKASGFLAILEESLADQRVALDRLVNLGAKIGHLRVAVPAKRELLLDEVLSATQLSDERASADLDVSDEKAILVRLLADLTDFEVDDPPVVDVFELHDEQEKLEATLFSATHRLQSWPNKTGPLLEWRDQLDAFYDLELGRIDQARRRLGEVTDVHSEESFTWALEHPDRALGQLESAMTLLRVVTIGQSPDSTLDEVGQTLEAAGLELLVADDLMDQMDDLLVDLDRARIESHGMIEQSKAVFESFASFVATHADDLTPELIDTSDQLAITISELDHELGLARPNYLRVAQAADRLNREIDDVMIEADGEPVEGALDRAVTREVARAQRSLQRTRASMGWQVVESPDSEALDQLAQRLLNLPSEHSAALDAASRTADAAMAVQERIIARRRRKAAWIVIDGGSSWSGSSWSTSSGWSGRSSTSAGSSFVGFSERIGCGSFGGGRSSRSW